MYNSRIRVNLLTQTIEPAPEQFEDGRRVVPGLATALQKDVDAGAQSLC